MPISPQVATQLLPAVSLRIGMILNDAEGAGKAADAGCCNLCVCKQEEGLTSQVAHSCLLAELHDP